MVNRIHVGCAGWSIPAEDRNNFGEGESALARYATRFSCVEINSSFHRPHRPATYARWAATVPAGFRFSVKLPKTISHEAGLRGAGPLLDRFLAEAGHLGDRLGALLLQLPPGLAFDARVATTFFAMLRRRTDLPMACEPRHASWFTPAAVDLLQRHAISRVAADPPRHPAGAAPAADIGCAYWRWHGSPRIYYSAYPAPALESLAEQVRQARQPGQVPWVIFDNTAHGRATGNALHLQRLLENDHA